MRRRVDANITDKNSMNIIVKIKNAFERFRILRRIRRGLYLSKEQELKLFKLPNAEELVKMYIQESSWNFCKEAQLMMFEQANAEELVKMYIQRGKYLCDKAQLKLFELSNAEELINLYIQRN